MLAECIGLEICLNCRIRAQQEKEKKKADHILVCTEAGMISILFSFGCFYEEKIEERVKKRKGEVTWERGVAN